MTPVIKTVLRKPSSRLANQTLSEITLCAKPIFGKPACTFAPLPFRESIWDFIMTVPHQDNTCFVGALLKSGRIPGHPLAPTIWQTRILTILLMKFTYQGHFQSTIFQHSPALKARGVMTKVFNVHKTLVWQDLVGGSNFQPLIFSEISSL